MSSPSKRKKNKHIKSAKRKLPEVFKIHGKKCFWCKRPLVWISELMRTKHVRIHKVIDDRVKYDVRGKVQISFYATSDHLWPVCMGGTSTMENLVPSCRPCNHNRTNGRNKFPYDDSQALIAALKSLQLLKFVSREVAMTCREQRIATRAYYKWMDAGCPKGSDERFWYDAEQEVISEDEVLVANRVVKMAKAAHGEGLPTIKVEEILKNVHGVGQ